MNYIYCYTNKFNNHKYVGQTNNIRRRKNEHYSMAYNQNSATYNQLFYKKIREYDYKNFSFEILEEIDNDDKSYVNQREIYWIKQKNSYVRYGQGYNLTIGGDGFNRERKIDDNLALQIIQDVKDNFSYEYISNKFNICPSYISMINQGLYFHQDNENYPIKKFFNTNDDYAELISLLQDSELTLKEISKKLDIGYSTIKKINAGTLRKGIVEKYPIRDKTIYQIKAERIKFLLLEGYSNKEIIELEKTSDETVRRINLGLTHYDENITYPIR